MKADHRPLQTRGLNKDAKMLEKTACLERENWFDLFDRKVGIKFNPPKFHCCKIAISQTIYWPLTGHCIQFLWSLRFWVIRLTPLTPTADLKTLLFPTYDCKEVMKNKPKLGILQECQNSHLLNCHILIYSKLFFPNTFSCI